MLPGICCCVIGSQVNSIWKDYSAYIFGVKQSEKSGWLYPEDEGTTILWNTGHHSHSHSDTRRFESSVHIIQCSLGLSSPIVWFVDHTYLIPCLFTPCSRVLLEKVTDSQQVKFPAFTSAHFMVLHPVRLYTSLSVDSAAELHTCLFDESKHCGNICHLYSLSGLARYMWMGCYWHHH